MSFRLCKCSAFQSDGHSVSFWKWWP